jgi:hypothetical protein
MAARRKSLDRLVPLPVVYRATGARVVHYRGGKSKSAGRLVSVSVEYFRADYNQGRALERYLKEYEAVQSVSRPLSKASGAVEVGYLLRVYVLPVIVSYAGNKVLKIVEDRIKQWFKEHGEKDQFITLELSGQQRRRKLARAGPSAVFSDSEPLSWSSAGTSGRGVT